jgi:hypothetical protein
LTWLHRVVDINVNLCGNEIEARILKR